MDEEQKGSPKPECAGKPANWLHELITKGSVSVNPTCCMNMEEEEEGYVNVMEWMMLTKDGRHLMRPGWTWKRLGRRGDDHQCGKAG
jgi:hypothetical protein